MTLFVDTTVWYAAADSGDRSNTRAKAILGSKEPLVTTDHVLVETWVLLRRRLSRAAADRFWEGLRSGVATLEPVGAGDLELAWAIGESFPDQEFSVVDRTSFAVMQRLGLVRSATFDSDFAIYRYGARRDRAFEIIR